MSDFFPKKFKIIVLQKESLPKHDLNDVIIHCSTIKKCKTILEENSSSNLILACDNDTLHDIASLLEETPNIDTLYVCTEEADIMWPIEMVNSGLKWHQISNEEQLMRHLYLKSMLCYVEQGDQYKKHGNSGLANLCFLDAQKALKQTEIRI